MASRPSEPVKMLSVRVPKSLFDAVRRAALDARIQGRPANTNAKIVEAAIREWLRREGHIR